jgi:hypothetical protein
MAVEEYMAAFQSLDDGETPTSEKSRKKEWLS